MVLGLFGKKKPEEKKPTAQAQAKSSQDAELERQRKLVNMQKTLEEIREKIDDGYKKIDDKQAKIKDLIRQKKKNEAKRHLQVMKTYQEELAKQENMCIILEKTKIQLEVAHDMDAMVNVFKDVAVLQKEAEKNLDFLQDFAIDQQEIQQQNKEISELLGSIAQGDDEEKEAVDEMYKELEQQVLDEQIDGINDDPLKNAVKPQVQPVTTNTSTTISSKASAKIEESSIDDLLSQAAQYS